MGRALGVVDRLSARLDIGRDAVIVARGERVEVVQALEGDGVLGRAEADGGGVPGDLALSNIVRGLGTDKETIAADNSVSSEGGALEYTQSDHMEKMTRSAARTLKRSRKARVCRPGCL